MTQKELLYLEDAYKHEENIIKILDVSINCMEDKELFSFLKGEEKKHKLMKEKIMTLLKGLKNE